MSNSLTADQIRAVLEAQGIPTNKQDRIIDELLLKQSTPAIPPPIGQDELRQILHYIVRKSITQWPSWPVRKEVARAQFGTLFAALDARDAAEQNLADELANLSRIIGDKP